MGKFLMPSLGADMEAGTLVEWEKKPGDPVRHGDIVAVVETQKGAIEIEAFEDGVLDSYLVEIGRKVPVGTPLAVIRGENEPPGGIPEEPSPAGRAAEDLPLAETEASAEFRASDAPAVAAAVRTRSTPAARRAAAAAGIDLASLRGTGPGGAIVLEDVVASVPSAGDGRKPGSARHVEEGGPGSHADIEARAAPFDFSAMRAAIASAMARSKREIPHYYLSHTVELTAAENFVGRWNAGRPPSERLLLGALFVRAVALALAKSPEFNGHFADGTFRPSRTVHAGVAINIRGGGLVAPAIHDAGNLPLDILMERMRSLVARVRAGRFRASELADPTITVSSLGERGVEALFGVIYPPQVAIVGFGAPQERPWVDAGTVVARRTVALTLAADHRVSDGHRGARFLETISDLLQRPEEL